ncbi:SusC/RagA family TonB-linked outer membrane protein [Pedobacter sp. KBS0701]|uniref:SusC/RagA family TonB-linked outer membrane protein n=1 Tax=Pedobacter sp. KBS0701 TaxID=2578106 RepID=UPI00110E81F0|nr:SusC/RagA family TonB-linked outer membrane protein [Pedobacter sp. KBS0701]QDW25345.1 SusC/RagA family TonB-linked outer membrane protein [Pedobacter sp. KBS0701]
MKLTTILLLVGALHVSAVTFSQTVTLSRRKTSLKQVFKEIKKQTGYFFFYKGQLLQDKPDVMVEFNNVPLVDALNASLKDQNLSYNIVNKTIVISRKENLPAVAASVAVKIEVKGVVADKATGETLPGVNVSIKNGASVGITNDKGEFKVNVEEGSILVFSYVGYELFETKVTGTKTLNVKLTSKMTQMNDVVVTGYQTIKKDNYTGNAVTISGDQLRRVNPQNLLQSIGTFDPSFKLIDNNLAGSNPNRIPSINVRGASALPSGDGQVLRRDDIQGNANRPVFMLDGYEVSVEKVFDLDVNRIASVTSLKDAAATAIYGSRAANGVIVITTKTPLEGKLRVEYNYELNFTAADLSDYQVLDAAEKLDYEVLAGLYSSSKQQVPQDQLDEIYYHKKANVVGGVNSYWLSQPLRNTIGHKHAINLDGGSQAFRYNVNLRYQTRPGAMKGSERDQYSGGMSFQYNVNKLQFRNELSITQVGATESPYGDFSSYVRMNPYYPLKDANGMAMRISDVYEKQDRSKEYVFNPLFDANLSSFNKSKYTEIIDNLSADLEVAKDLRLRAQMSVTTRSNSDDIFTSPQANKYYLYTTDKIDEKGEYTNREMKETYWDSNIRLTWLKQIGGNYFNALVGVNARTELRDQKEFTAIGFANDRFTSIGFAKGYAEDGKPQSRLEKARLFGSFFSMNYSYKNRYLMDGTVRIDGSSKFGVNNKLAPFWSFGLGWNVHQEEFLKGNPVISQLRIKASTGLTGSVEFDPYLSKTIYKYNTGNWYSSGIGAGVNSYGNENLGWQKTRMTDIGIDIGLFKDRVMIMPRIYKKFTKDILADITLPPSTGFLSYKENLGDMENKGAELGITVDALRSKDWSVNLNANMVTNRNKVVRISNALKKYNDRADELQSLKPGDGGYRGIPLLRFSEGQPFNAIYGVRSLGIDPENGRELYLKKDGTLTYDYDKRDYVVIGDPNPKVSGYFGGTVNYKRFSLYVQFQTFFGGDKYNLTLVERVENADPRYNVDKRVFEEKWKQPGDLSFYKNIADNGETDVSSRFIQPDNLINLQSVNFSYDMNKKIASKLSMSSLMFQVTANDVVRWSSVKEERGINYPFTRSLTFSVRAAF